jgi:nitrous oxide reductase accessory protein NosL
MDRRTLIRGALLLAAIPPAAAADDKSTPAVDPAPAENDIDKYPRCVVCNMDRRKFHFARHLLHYGDGQAEGTCSINCAAECMLRERRRGFKAVYAPDYGAEGDPKPLIEASAAVYLIGSDLRGVMAPVSKYAFAHDEAARRAQAVAGGKIGTFDEAIASALGDYATSLARRYKTDRERQARKTEG